MPILIFRHGTTSKNLTGAVDDLDTLLDELGRDQARQLGSKVLAYCRENEIRKIIPVTSGALRTRETAQLVLDVLRQHRNLEIAPLAEDFRLGEIKFRSRDFIATDSTPGLFGRQIDYFGNQMPVSDARFAAWRAEFDSRTETNGTLAELNEAYKAIVTDWVAEEIPPDTVLGFFIHNTSSRRLIVEYTGRPLADMEQLVVGNCAMIELSRTDIIWHDQGFLTEREKQKALWRKKK